MKNPWNNEHGAVLIAGLMILVVLSLLGITSMQTSTLEERMANNMSQRQLAFQSAEAALRVAETRVAGLAGIDPTLPIVDPPLDVATLITTMDAGTDTSIQTANGITGVAALPTYLVERLQEMPKGSEVLDADAPIEIETMYRVTARGVGGVSTAEVILQVTHLQ